MRKIILLAAVLCWVLVAASVGIMLYGCGTAQHQGGAEFSLDENCMPTYSSARDEVAAGKVSYKRNSDGSCEVTVENVGAKQGRESGVSQGTGEVIKETPGTIKTFLPAIMGF